MRARFTILISLVLAFFLAGNVHAQDAIWTDGTGDHLWSTEGNWSEFPTLEHWVKIRVGLPGVTIASEGAVARRVHVGYDPNAVLTVDGGTLLIGSDDLLLGKNGGDATLNMISGTIEINRDLEVAGGDPGTINMRGGTIIVGDDFEIPESQDDANSIAEVHLDGGTIVLDGSYEADSRFRMYPQGLLDIGGGTLIVPGDETSRIQGYIDDGLIVAYGGNGTPLLDYDVTNSGRTTLKAVHDLNPSPTDRGTVGAGLLELSWTLPDPCTPGDPVPVDVYLTDDYYTLWNFNDPESIRVLNQANVTSVNVTVAGQTQYYWAVDTYIGSESDPILGPIFSFWVGNAPPTIEISADPPAAWLTDGTGQTTLDATVTDDATASPTLAWSVVSEPNEGTASIAGPTAADTVVTFTELGQYTLQLTADDGEALDNISTRTITIGVFNDSCEAAASLPGYAVMPGDINADCKVDFLDFAIIAGGWLECNALDCSQ